MRMKCVKDIKQYCLKEMSRHRELFAGAKAAGKPVIEASHRGAIDALHEFHAKLCIYFPAEPTDID